MRAHLRLFITLKTADQLRFFKSPKFLEADEKQRVDFLKEVLLRGKLSSKVTATAIRLLRELNFRDNFFFRKFIYHTDQSVVLAARKAIEPANTQTAAPHSHLPLPGGHDNRSKERTVEAVRHLLQHQPPSVEEMLRTYVQEDNLRARAMVVAELSTRQDLDERRLLEMLGRSVWFIRAAIVEILGNRRSECLLEKAETVITDPNVDVRLKLIAALSAFDRERTRPLLQKLTGDAHIRVRREAQHLLSAN